ncbi:MAG: SCO family protein [Leptospira sp.]|nr:SCO family protein [Leptospira sp.]NCS93995.1 SCO family protein [Leptospira sp.]
MGSNRIILPLTVFLIAMAFAFVFTNKVQKEGPEIEEEVHPMPELLELTMQNQNKEIISLKDLGDSYKLIYFGQLSASDLDWEAVLKMERMASQNFKKPLTPIFFSLDPKRDTIPILQKSLQASAEHVQALFPSQDKLDYLAKAYGIHYQKSELPNSNLNYTIDHNTWYYLTTPDYRILGSYPIQIQDERLIKEIIAHMKQKH